MSGEGGGSAGKEAHLKLGGVSYVGLSHYGIFQQTGFTKHSFSEQMSEFKNKCLASPTNKTILNTSSQEAKSFSA